MVTIINKTIGATGRDYATFALAEADVTNIGTSADLVANDEAIVFTVDAGTYGAYSNSSPLTVDSTHNVTYRCADRSNRPLIDGGSSFQAVQVKDDHTHFDGIDVQTTGGSGFKAFDPQVGIRIENSRSTALRGIMFANETTMGSASDPIVFRNVISSAKDYDLRLGDNTDAVYVDVINVASVSYTESRNNKPQIQIQSTAAGQANIYNFVNLDSTANRQIETLATVSGSNNIGLAGGDSARSFSTYGIGSEKTPTTNTSPGAGDFVIFVSATGQLVHGDENDAADAGVGPTAQSLVPSIGILGESRSGATTQVGAFATLFGAPSVTFEDVILNTQTDPGLRRETFRNPFGPGPDPSKAFVTLPDDTVPVFLVLGDSTSMGFNKSWNVTTVKQYIAAQGEQYPDAAYDGSAYGYFWDKYMSTSDSGVTWTKAAGLLTDISTSGDGFEPIHPRLGGQNLNGTFTYDGNEGDVLKNYLGATYKETLPAQPGAMSPLWDFARGIKGLFKYSDGTEVAPYFIYMGVTSTRLGHPGLYPYFDIPLDFHNKIDASADSGLGYAYRQYRQTYIRPAVKNLIDADKNPILAGQLFMIGAIEANASYPDSYRLSAIDTYLDHRNSIKFLLNTEVNYPIVSYLPWITGNDTGEATYPSANIRQLYQKVHAMWQDGLISSRVSLQDLPRDTDDGIHFQPQYYADYGKRFADAYRSMLTVRKINVVAPTMGNITF